MRKTGLMLFILLLTLLPKTTAQGLQEIHVRVTQNTLVYSGPGTNGAYLEYIAAGRELVAAGRNSDSSWILINIDQQIEGWVPAYTLTPLDGEYETLFLRGGLLAIADAPYSVENPNIRAAELEMLRIQRQMRYIGARIFRLQGYLGASCQQIPVPPAPPNITSAQIAGVPELETVQRELTWIQEQTTLAILIYEQMCVKTGAVDLGLYDRAIGHINPAYGAYTNLRKFVDGLTGLTFAAN